MHVHRTKAATTDSIIIIIRRKDSITNKHHNAGTSGSWRCTSVVLSNPSRLALCGGRIYERKWMGRGATMGTGSMWIDRGATDGCEKATCIRPICSVFDLRCTTPIYHWTALRHGRFLFNMPRAKAAPQDDGELFCALEAITRRPSPSGERMPPSRKQYADAKKVLTKHYFQLLMAWHEICEWLK